MAKQPQQQQPQRRTIPTQGASITSNAGKKAPAPVRREVEKKSLFSTGSNKLIFGRENYIWFGAGLALILGGLAAMLGGSMPSPDEWKPEIIYSFRRITLAPILMVAGFLVVMFGIFRKDKSIEASQTQGSGAAITENA